MPRTKEQVASEPIFLVTYQTTKAGLAKVVAKDQFGTLAQQPYEQPQRDTGKESDTGKSSLSPLTCGKSSKNTTGMINTWSFEFAAHKAVV